MRLLRQFSSRRWPSLTTRQIYLFFVLVVGYLLIRRRLSSGKDGAESYAELAQSDEGRRCRAAPENENIYGESLTRAIVAYFSVAQTKVYIDQLRWCMRSLLEMMEDEPVSWRTDIILFVENTSLPELLGLGCSLTPRITLTEPFKCVLVEYVRIVNRKITENSTVFERDLQEQLKEYPYGESLVPLAENPKAYADYDIVIRSDLDVFFTRTFARWIPSRCGFVTGNGGYSDTYNMEKLAHVANYSKQYFNSTIWNIGSTWIGPSELVAKVAARAVHWMIELSKNNFSPKMRTLAWWSQIQLWPEWHYGVLSMYGSHLAINELILARKDIAFQKMELDHPTTSTANCSLGGPIHLHTYQSAGYFSKYLFNERRYVGNLSLPTKWNSSRCNDYAAFIAADSIAMTSAQLAQRLRGIKSTKLATSP